MPLTPPLRSDSERVKDKKITELFRRVHILETRLGNLLQELDKADLEIAKARYELFLAKAKEATNDKSRKEGNNSNSPE